ncbi:NACHT domain- and WD repeat-containing protein 1 [Podarcis raffonei]|uniref:NACHT domain- and WD repeat-containing protein 1 n=1 Tax=Podarcis raffonei TaxID=65483 RepID=UPI00232915C3|nr:NACHT domain- and WD repeat-containing protein 1 [Podarcis raffonei]
MEAEREALMESAYPEVQAFCQKHGLMFEVIDLRWGVRDVTGAGQEPLFLDEIRRCQELSVGPSFVALLGSRYGPCPAPATIGEEEFEALAAQLQQEEPQALQMLTRRYLKDENATPPVYALQRPLPHGEQQSLVLALRTAAREAERKGLIGQCQRLRYHKSDTHREIEARLLGPEDEGAAVVFLRETETSLDEEGEEEGEEEDEDARQMLEELKGTVASACPGLLRVHRAPHAAAPGALRQKPQPKHLKELCDQFVAVANYQAIQALRAREGHPGGGRLLQELSHHAALAREHCRTPCWRPELVDSLCQRLRDSLPRCHPPLVVHGPPGCGKTVLLCHLRGVACQALGPEAVVVFRLLGASQDSCGRDALLASLCQQVCLALGLSPLGTGDPLLRFHHALLSASRQASQPLVLILDATESLGTAWLPAVCPPGVQLVISAQDEGGSGGAFGGDPFVVAPLSAKEAGKALAESLASAGRTLQPEQRALFWQSFSNGGQALPLSLAVAEARRWPSFASLSALAVPLTAAEAAHRLCGRLEEAHGSVLVANALSYLACTRNGLSEAEMKDVLSLDNEVLSEVYRSHPPPGKGVLRLPPLLWSHLRRDLNPELEEKWSDGFVLMGFLHRSGATPLPPLFFGVAKGSGKRVPLLPRKGKARSLSAAGHLLGKQNVPGDMLGTSREFSAAVEERYLSRPEDRVRRHLLLADFFRGTWSWGAKKPIVLPSSAKPVSVDRKVTPQPLWFSSRLPNRRKLSEQPFHLLHGGRMEELRRDVLGNMAWISCRVASSGVRILATDFALCLTHIFCPELRLVRDCLLLLLDPSVDDAEGRLEPNVVYTEMLARLESLASSYPGGLIAGLCQQCKSWLGSRPHPSLVPLDGFLDPPDGPLRKTLPGFPKGTSVLEASPDQRVLLAGSLDGSIIVWDTEDFSVRHVLLGHSAEVRCLRVFARGTCAISVAQDRTLRLWSLESGREEAVVPAVPAGDQEWCQLSVDDKHQIVYWVSGSEVEAWHLGTAAPAFRILAEPPGGWLCAAVFVPRLVVVTVSAGGCVRLWDSLSGQLLSRQQLGGLPEDAAPTCGALLRKMGRMVSGFSGGSLLMVSSEGNGLLEKLPEKICFVALSEDESLLAAGFGCRVRIFRPDPTGFHQVLNSDLLHDEEVCAAAIAADNTTVFTSSRSECVWVWRLGQEGWLRDVWGDEGPPATHLTLCGALLVSASPHAPYLRVWDPRDDPGRKPLLPCMASTKCVGLSGGGKYVCFPRSLESCELVLWDVEEDLMTGQEIIFFKIKNTTCAPAGEERETLDTSAAVRCLEVAPQRNLAFVGLASGTVLVFPLDSAQDVGCIPPAENRKPVCALALARSEEQVAVACKDLVQVLDVGRGDPVPLIDRPAFSFYTQIPGADISCVALLGGYRVLYGMTTGQLFLYHCPQGQVFALEAHGSSGVTCLQTSHREAWALSGAADSLQCLWDVDRCHWEHQMSFRKEDSFSQGVLCACFSTDDRLLFTASLDQCVTVWDVSCGALLAVQLVHARVTRIVPTPDGFMAVTKLGYLIRERFLHPPSTSSRYDPLGGIRATCRVTSRRTSGEEDEDVAGGQLAHRGDHATQARHSHLNNKLSQICRIG